MAAGKEPWSDGTVEHATSADGTRIGSARIGPGRPVVIVGGAFSTADAGRPLAAALANAGLQGVVVDRCGRGSSGDTAPYAPQREAEDLAAVLQAVGRDAAVLGHSSGAMLTLLAAAEGMDAAHLFLSEPPFRFWADEPDLRLPERLESLVDAADRLARTIAQAELVIVPESHDHAVDPVGTTREVLARIG